MKKYLFIVVIAVSFLNSCTKDDPQMDRTIFIPDPIDNRLPAYSEWGYNSFGAKSDRNYFLASDDIIPCKIMYKDGMLNFSLSGYFDYSNYGGLVETTMTFVFPIEQIHEYTDLLTLNGKTIDLASPDCEVTVTQNGTIDTLNIIDGELQFRRAQKLSIDDQPNRVILSGVFDFRYLDKTDEFPVSVSDGRFDLGINKNLFYAY